VFVFLEEPDEKECSDTLVAIGEWMILDDEVEEMSSLFLYRRIEISTIESRDDRGEDTDEALVFLITENIIGF
jgi:hypothetical protein